MNNRITLINQKPKQKHIHYAIYWVLLIFLLFNQSLIHAESSALKDNPIKIDSSFSNYHNFNVKVDVPSYPLHGNFRFLKISDDLGNTLFLGQISATHSFKLPLHVLKTTTQLTIEIFSEDVNEQTIVIKKQIVTGELL